MGLAEVSVVVVLTDMVAALVVIVVVAVLVAVKFWSTPSPPLSLSFIVPPPLTPDYSMQLP